MPVKLKWINHADLAIKRNPVVPRDEYIQYMTFQRNDRPLFTEIFGPLIGLKEEWEEQGATPQELDFSAFRYRDEARFGIPVQTGLVGGYPEQDIEETADYRLFRDALGRTMKLSKGYSTLPLPLDYPVETMDDWLKIKHWYQFHPSRLAGDWEVRTNQALAQGKVISVSIPGGYDETRGLMGEEALSLAYYDQPELIHDILETLGDTAYQVLEHVSAHVPIDMIHVHEDMAGKSGPMVGPRIVKNFIAPYYRKVWDLLSARGTLLFEQDSDGNMEAVIPAFLDAGINVIYPCEPAAGMDIVKLRQQYGTRLAFRGGLDKHVLRKSKEEILAELNYKLPPIIQTGGCVMGLDHRVPNGTPLENYRFYIQKSWEIINREEGHTTP